MRKLTLNYLLFVLFISFASVSQAKDEIYTGFFSNKAVSGYDVVSYFTQGKPVEGKSQYSTEYKDATWLFSSEENLNAFKENPEKYAPQYGGYCAYAVAKGSTASADPLQWTIVNDKLYLNYNAEVNEQWREDPEKFIKQANENWPTVLD